MIKSHVESSNNEGRQEHTQITFTSINCKGCKNSFWSNSLLKHLAKARKCQTYYTKKEREEMISISKSNFIAQRKQWESSNKIRISERKSSHYKSNKNEILMKRKINYQDKKGEILEKRKVLYQENQEEIMKKRKINIGKKAAAEAKLYHKNDIAAYKKVLEAQAHRKNEKMFFLLHKTFSKEIVRIENHLTKNVDNDTLEKVKILENSMTETSTFYKNLIQEKSLSVKDEQHDWNLVANTFDQIFNVYSKGTDFITSEWNKLKKSLDKDLKEIALLKKIRIICKGCQKAIVKKDQLNHLSKYKKCFSAYSESELELRGQWFKWLKDKHQYNQGPLVSKEDKEDFSNPEDSESEQSQE